MCVFIYTLTLWYIKVDRTLDIKEMGNAIRKFATMRLIIRLDVYNIILYRRLAKDFREGWTEFSITEMWVYLSLCSCITITLCMGGDIIYDVAFLDQWEKSFFFARTNFWTI